MGHRLPRNEQEYQAMCSIMVRGKTLEQQISQLDSRGHKQGAFSFWESQQAAPLPLGGQQELLQAAAAWTFGGRGSLGFPGSQVAPRLLRRSLQGLPGMDSSVKLV